jgi:hypothetical protein
MADEMTEQELAEIEGRLQWLPNEHWHTEVVSNRVVGDFHPINPIPFQDRHIADFVAHARQDVPRLLAEVKRLRALLNAPPEVGG